MFRTGPLAGIPPPHAYWTADILELDLSGVGERDASLSAHLRVDRIGSEDANPFGLDFPAAQRR